MPQSMGKIVRLGFGILIPSTMTGLKSLVLSMLLWCHRAFGKIVRLGFGILIPSPRKGLKSLGVIYWYTNNKMCHRHDDFRSRTSFQYVSHTWRAWRYVNCFDRSRCGSWLSMTFGPTSSIPESSNRTENFAQVVGLRAVHVLNRLIDAVQISTL